MWSFVILQACLGEARAEERGPATASDGGQAWRQGCGGRRRLGALRGERKMFTVIGPFSSTPYVIPHVIYSFDITNIYMVFAQENAPLLHSLPCPSSFSLQSYLSPSPGLRVLLSRVRYIAYFRMNSLIFCVNYKYIFNNHFDILGLGMTQPECLLITKTCLIIINGEQTQALTADEEHTKRLCWLLSDLLSGFSYLTDSTCYVRKP